MDNRGPTASQSNVTVGQFTINIVMHVLSEIMRRELRMIGLDLRRIVITELLDLAFCETN